MIRFGTSGWRAIISDTFTFRNVRLVTQAIANFITRGGPRDPGVVIGYDTRFLSEKVARETATVLSANGVRAYLCQRDAPTPAVAREVAVRGAAGGIYFTASHNPPEYNGLKFYDRRGAPAATGLTDQIELEILRLENQGFDRAYLADERRIETIDPQEAYLKHLLGSLDLGRVRAAGLKLAVDCLYGTSREYLDRVLIDNECPVEVIHNFADPYFGGYSPACSEKNLGELRGLVLDNGCGLGLAVDGDGDRFGVLDRDGSFVPADDLLPMLVDYLVRERGLVGGVARTAATSHLLDKVAAGHGLEVIETAVGFKYIADLLLEGSAMFGGEESAGFTHARHLPEKDGVLACLLVAELVANSGKSLAELRQELWARHGPHHHRMLTFDLSPELSAGLAASLDRPPDRLDGQSVVKVTRVDGVKLYLADGSWCLLRPSGTEPVVRLYAESSSPDRLERLIHAARGLIGHPR